MPVLGGGEQRGRERDSGVSMWWGCLGGVIVMVGQVQGLSRTSKDLSHQNKGPSPPSWGLPEADARNGPAGHAK